MRLDTPRSSAQQTKILPFTTHRDDIRTVQGIYLARSTPFLNQLFSDALALQGGDDAESNLTLPVHQEYEESRRLQKERFFFARNRSLARSARQRDNYTCQVCGFRFRDCYESIGDDFIEVHHLDPLADRVIVDFNARLSTSLDQVVSVCSNCHRMLHRRRPCYSVEELAGLLVKRRNMDSGPS